MLSEQLCCRGERKFAGCRFTFGADVGKAECRDRNVGVVGSGDLASDHDFFFGGELAVWLYAATINADVTETSAGLFVAAGVERDAVMVAFPPEGRTVRDVAVVAGKSGVDGGEGEGGFLFRTTLVSRLSSLVYFNYRPYIPEGMRTGVLERNER